MGPDGQPQSKGIGFVEFSEHEHAIVALRQMNNNPQVFSRWVPSPAGGSALIWPGRCCMMAVLWCWRVRCTGSSHGDGPAVVSSAGGPL